MSPRHSASTVQDTAAPGVFTAAEALLALAVCGLALAALISDGFDALGIGLRPWPILGVTLIALALGIGGMRRWGDRLNVVWDGWDALAVVGVVGLTWGGLVWLAGPSHMPLTNLEDAVVHWMLVQWLVDFGRIPGDPALSIYLGGLGRYPPGFHYIAALAALGLDMPAVRVIHPLVSLFVALKFGGVYRLTARLVGGGVGQAAGLLSVALLLLAYSYSLYSFMVWSFYPQVAAETFAIAALWAIFWLVNGGRLAAASVLLMTLCGLILTWPAWLPIVLATLGIVFFRWRRVAVRWRLRVLVGLGVGLGLVVLLDPNRLLRYLDQATASGGVVAPTVAAFSPPLLLLGGVGVITALVVAPRAGPAHYAWVISVFAGATALQMLALYLTSRLLSPTTLYPTFKIAHLLIYPLAVLGAALVGWLAHRISQSRPTMRPLVIGGSLLLAGSMFQAAVAEGMVRDIPPSGMTEEVYQVGQWAAAHLPPACIEYNLPHRISRFWLHTGLLGNAWWIPERRPGIVTPNGLYRVLDEWRVNPAGRRFAIVDNWRSLPAEVRDGLTVLYTFGDIAVVEHPDTTIVCPANPYPPRPRPPQPAD